LKEPKFRGFAWINCHVRFEDDKLLEHSTTDSTQERFQLRLLLDNLVQDTIIETSFLAIRQNLSLHSMRSVRRYQDASFDGAGE
jgi:hypothetical protein